MGGEDMGDAASRPVLLQGSVLRTGFAGREGSVPIHEGSGVRPGWDGGYDVDPDWWQGQARPAQPGYSGVNTTPREHARFLYLALNKGKWDGKQVVPTAHYDFAWAPSKANPTYGAKWWVYPRHKDGPKDMVQTAGANNNHGYVVPSKGLVFVRLGDGKKFEKGFEQELIKLVLSAVK